MCRILLESSEDAAVDDQAESSNASHGGGSGAVSAPRVAKRQRLGNLFLNAEVVLLYF
jgi:hypothetical protein